MSNSKRDLEERILTAAQIFAIGCAGIWVFFTYVYAEYWKPKSAPVNISLDVSLKKINPDKDHKKNSLVGIEMKVSVTNMSHKEIKLLPSLFHARGRSIKPTAPCKEGIETVNEEELNNGGLEFGGCYYKLYKQNAPGVYGLLLEDDNIMPNGKLNRTLVFYVPKNAYDKVRVRVRIPNTDYLPEGLSLKWAWNKSASGFETNFYQEHNNSDKGKPNCLTCENRKSLNDMYKRYQIQETGADAELSLWESSGESK